MHAFFISSSHSIALVTKFIFIGDGFSQWWQRDYFSTFINEGIVFFTMGRLCFSSVFKATLLASHAPP